MDEDERAIMYFVRWKTLENVFKLANYLIAVYKESPVVWIEWGK